MLQKSYWRLGKTTRCENRPQNDFVLFWNFSKNPLVLPSGLDLPTNGFERLQNLHFVDAYKTAEKVPSTNSLLQTWTFMTHPHGEGAGTGALFLGNGANSGPTQARAFAG